MFNFKKTGFGLMIFSSGIIFMFIPKCVLRPYTTQCVDKEIVETVRQLQVFDENEMEGDDPHLFDQGFDDNEIEDEDPHPYDIERHAEKQ
jgi:hypothetical protein